MQAMCCTDTERRRDRETSHNTRANANLLAASQQPQPLGDRQRQKHQVLPTDMALRAAQDDVAQKARMLWAADRVACRLAKAVSLVRDGRQPKDPEMVLAALEKFKYAVHDADEKVVLTRSRKAEEAKRRREAVEAKRDAEDAKMEAIAAHRKAAEESRTCLRRERENARIQRAESIVEAKRDAELQRRTRMVKELVEKDWEKEQQHVHTARLREVHRRQSARALQEREAAEVEQFDVQRRQRTIVRLEKEAGLREAADPQVIKALPGHPAKLGGHSKNIAPYAMQLRDHGYQLSRWQQK